MSQPTSGPDRPAVTALQHDRWRVAPWFILRTAGFPLELIGLLRFTATSSAIEGLLAAEDRQGKLPPDQLASAQATFESELAANTQRLRELAGTDMFREAVFLSNPESYALIERWIDGHPQTPSKFRQGLLTVVRYLQRFCMKNDTASFFGPFFWGHFDPEHADCVQLAPDASPAVKRTTFFSHWAAHTLARWASLFPRASAAIRPRRVPTTMLYQRLVRGLVPHEGRWQLVDQPVDLPAYASELLTLIDGERTLDAVVAAGCARWRVAPDELRAVLDQLTAARLINTHIELPVGPTEPLEYLRDELARADVAEALPVIEQFIALKDAFAAADLTERRRVLQVMGALFAQTTGALPARGAGRHYADRSLIYEDGLRGLAALTIGGRLAQDILDLSPLWELLSVVHARDQRLTRQTGADWFRQRFPNRRAVTFLEYARAFLEDAQTLEAHFNQNDASVQTLLHDLFNRLIPADAGAQPAIKLTMDDIRKTIAELREPDDEGAIVNPDLMVMAGSLDDLNQGRYRLVLGEVHTAIDLLTHTPLTYALPEAEREALRRFVSARYADIAAPDEWVVDVMRLHLRKTSAQLALDAPHVEAEGRSPKSRREVVGLADLEIHLADDRLRLYAPGWRRYLRLTSMRVPNGNTETANLLRPFALSEHEGVIPMPLTISYHPRVEVGKIVLLRRTWRVHYQDWRDKLTEVQSGWSIDLFMNAARMRRELDLPERVFAKVAGETKPIFVDFSDYFLIHSFCKLWQKHQGIVVLSEACPDISDAWLHDERGHYFCELRIGFYRQAEHQASKTE